MKDVLLALLHSLRKNEAASIAVSDDFVAIEQGVVTNADDFFHISEYNRATETWVDVEVIASFDDSDGHAALLWDGTEPITGTRWRYAWFAWFSGLVMTRIITTSQRVVSDPSATLT